MSTRGLTGYKGPISPHSSVRNNKNNTGRSGGMQDFTCPILLLLSFSSLCFFLDLFCSFFVFLILLFYLFHFYRHLHTLPTSPPDQFDARTSC